MKDNGCVTDNHKSKEYSQKTLQQLYVEKLAVCPKHDTKEYGKEHKRGRKAIEQVARNSYTFRLLADHPFMFRYPLLHFSDTSYPIILLALYTGFSTVPPNIWQKLSCTSVKCRMVSGGITTVEALRISSSLLSSVVSGLPVFSQNVSVALQTTANWRLHTLAS